MKPRQWQVVIILVIAVLAVSTGAIFIGLSIEAAGVRGELSQKDNELTQ